jgi:hypothetical protein
MHAEKIALIATTKVIAGGSEDRLLRRFRTGLRGDNTFPACRGSCGGLGSSKAASVASTPGAGAGPLGAGAAGAVPAASWGASMLVSISAPQPRHWT